MSNISAQAMTKRAREQRVRGGLGRPLLAASAALVACVLMFAGLPAAQATAIEGGPSIGDTLFAGIGNTGYDVVHYDVRMNYTHEAAAPRLAGSIIATTTISAHAPVELGSFSLDFEGMMVDSVTVNGVPATFTRSTNKAIEAFKLHIVPASPVEGDFTIAVEYSGVPTMHVDNDGSEEGWVAADDGVIALGQPVGTMTWLPSNNTPADKATFDIALTVPTDIRGSPAAAVSNGELVSKTRSTDDLETTWKWAQRNQMATMSTMLSIGNYDIFENDITLSDGRVIPEWSFVDSNMSAEDKEKTELQRQKIQEITQFLESKYGPYLGNSTGIVVDPSNVSYALECQDRSYFPIVPYTDILVHEMAHQWFGTAVSPADWNSIWVSEGQASYASELYVEGNGGAPTSTTYFAMWESTAATDPKWRVAPAAMTDQTQLFGWHVYTRGGMTFEALRQVLGDDVYFQLLTQWTQRNSGSSMLTEDFIALAEEVSGKNLGAFFQDWIYETDKPAWPSPTPQPGRNQGADQTSLAATGSGEVLGFAVGSAALLILVGGALLTARQRNEEHTTPTRH